MFLVGMETARYVGCRILHEVAVDTVNLKIYGGFIPERPARDEPVQFMLNRPDLVRLIAHLEGIRDEIDASDAAAGKVIQLHRERNPAHG